MQAITLTIDAGNDRAGAKSWAKHLTAIDPSKPNGYGLVGEWLPRSGKAALPEGALVVASGRGGSWKNTTSAYVLARVKAGAEFEHSAGYQSFRGTGLELVTTSADEVDTQAILDEHPDLAPVVGGKLLGLFAAARRELGSGAVDRGALIAERAELSARLAEIDQLLGES